MTVAVQRLQPMDFLSSLAPGATIILARTKKPYGPGTYRLDRIAAVDGGNQWVTEVESGAGPIASRQAMYDGQWDQSRFHTYTLSGHRTARFIDVERLWRDYQAAGSPRWRSYMTVRRFIEQYLVYPDA